MCPLSAAAPRAIRAQALGSDLACSRCCCGFCYYCFILFLFIYLFRPSPLVLGQDPHNCPFPKPQTEMRWLMHPAKHRPQQCRWRRARSTRCQGMDRETSNPSRDHFGLSARPRAARHPSSGAGRPGDANGRLQFSGASRSLLLLQGWWQLMVVRVACSSWHQERSDGGDTSFLL